MEDRLPDEDVLVIPDSWLRSLHPRRGGTPVPAVTPDEQAVQAVAELIGRVDAVVEALREGRRGEPDLAEAARRHLEEEPDPVGAAVIAAVVLMGVGGAEKVHRSFFDAWVIEHGLPFAACALVEACRIKTVRDAGSGAWLGVERCERWAAPQVGVEPLRRARTLLAQADEPVYQEAVQRLADHRDTPATRWVVSYLVPTRLDWVDQCCASPPGPAWGDGRHTRWLLLHSLSTAGQLAALDDSFRIFYSRECSPALLATLADGLGTDALALLLHNLDHAHLGSEDRRLVFEALAALPSDEAFGTLLERSADRHARAALRTAAKNFPVRALRMPAAVRTADAKALLAEHVALHTELVRAVLPELPAEVRKVVEPLATSERVPDAPPEAVPAALTERPWENPIRPVVTGLRSPVTAEVVWAEGEREEWLRSPHRIDAPEDPDWEAYAAGHQSSRRRIGLVQALVYGPVELVRPLLVEFAPHLDAYRSHVWLSLLAARFELDALPPMLRMARRDPLRLGGTLVPFRTAEVALLMGDWLAQGKKAPDAARAWLDRHGTAAVPLLVPAVLGKTAGPRRSAEHTLRHIAARHGLDDVVEAARAAHGDEAAGALESVLRAHPAQTGTAGPPKIGDWVQPASLPQVLLRGREHALPAEAVRLLIEVLALPVPYRMEEIRQACDPDSLAEFGWALFAAWRGHGAPSADGWAFRQLGRTGDDETVRRLTPIIRAWPGEGGHRHAVTGLDVLAEIGTDVALMHLNGIADKVRFKGLREEARRKVGQVADALGLTTEQLADRLVPTLGLDDGGRLTLDYGPRRFVVGFDEQLKPVIADEDGRPRKALPKPGAKDDPELAPAAHKRFAALKKDVRTIASGQLQRMERAMTFGRTWSADEFRRYIVEHPLVWHVARRLVWLGEDGGTTTPFRIAEDRTLADVEDDAFVLPETAKVRIAHPVDLGEDAVKAWLEVFSDYELTQPFLQLTRTVHALTDEERASGRLERFEGLKVPYGDVLALVRRGWERGTPLDAGVERWISRRVADDVHVVIDLDPGFAVGALDATGDHQTLEYVWIAPEPDDYWPSRGTPLTFGLLPAAVASEVLADLTMLAEAAV
ncbi:DUF4132 domain-containing protein [Thermomonospora cellulosilytica]|uniref:DUF4132 domain-containing protein n=1 Tax=Thermomonospora cellulosilytica TaxID=1411118 RepID=A0A7W3MX76_9ACTN|nr:DUF4132 domain-containing protein [Thermomonospora cellulosilytica]MBA9003514.1 hypothetical protein [Thermomonospora cellulosilytica]